MRIAPPVSIRSIARNVKLYSSGARLRSFPARQIERARVVLLVAEGKTDLEIATSLNISN